jgi:D-alanyl-lipoteichoic acid acyltransferase DltB (MBOAT superfamily)
MIQEWLSDVRMTAASGIPALLMLPLLPVFLLVASRHVRQFYILSGFALLCVIDGLWIAGGILLGALVGYHLVEWVARRRLNRDLWFWAIWGLLHIAFFACYWIPPPAWYHGDGIREVDRASIFILFSGIGLSFFRLMSYFIDRVRRDDDRVSGLDFLAYMLFFPQIRHGPIERCEPFVQQLRESRGRWTWRDAAWGLGRLAGLVIALRIVQEVVRVLSISGGSWWQALFGMIDSIHSVEQILAHPEQLTTTQFFAFLALPFIALWMLEASFTHVELASGRVFGVVGSENYRNCILSESPRTAWQRWNITLSQWLQRNVFWLINGRRRPMLATLVTFVYCGALHTPTQLRGYVWGLWCGLWVVGLIQWRRWFKPKRGPVTGWGQVRIFVQRALTLHWAMVTVVILIDYEHCGWRVILHYLWLMSWPVRVVLGMAS